MRVGLLCDEKAVWEMTLTGQPRAGQQGGNVRVGLLCAAAVWEMCLVQLRRGGSRTAGCRLSTLSDRRRKQLLFPECGSSQPRLAGQLLVW